MTHPPSACGASPSRGRHQRTGRAGSAAAAWLGQWLLATLTLLAAAGQGLATAAPPLPGIEKAKAGTQCVEEPALMRRSHMDFLKHQRDDTVRGGVRGARHSLKGCVDCHASAATGSVAAAATDFCASCHAYAAVKIDCFECHSGKPGTAVATGGRP